jgi:hypothetical protein
LTSVVERRQGRSDHSLEKPVSEAGVAGEDRPVEVGTHDVAAHRSFRAESSAGSIDTATKGVTTSEVGDARVVLVAGQDPHAFEGRRHTHLTDHPGAMSAYGLGVEQLEPSLCTARFDLVAGPDQLVARADREQRSPPFDSFDEAAGSKQREGLSLGKVLTASEDVDIALTGDDIAGLDLEHPAGDASPLETSGQHGGIPPVSVGAEQIWEQETDRQLRIPLRPLRHGKPCGDH